MDIDGLNDRERIIKGRHRVKVKEIDTDSTGFLQNKCRLRKWSTEESRKDN